MAWIGRTTHDREEAPRAAQQRYETTYEDHNSDRKGLAASSRRAPVRPMTQAAPSLRVAASAEPTVYTGHTVLVKEVLSGDTVRVTITGDSVDGLIVDRAESDYEDLVVRILGIDAPDAGRVRLRRGDGPDDLDRPGRGLRHHRH